MKCAGQSEQDTWHTLYKEVFKAFEWRTPPRTPNAQKEEYDAMARP